MSFFSVTTTVPTEKGTNVTYAFDAGEEIKTLDDLADELSVNGVITGNRYRVIHARDGNRARLCEKREVMLTQSGVASAVPFGSLEDYDVE